MRSSLRLLTFALAFVILGCQQSEPNTQTIQVASSNKIQSPHEDTMKEAAKYPYKGTVQYIGLEGGFYGITTDKGEKLLPLNLDKKYHKHGTVISFSGSYPKDIMTIQQWGKPFRLLEVQLISLGQNSHNPDL